MRSLVAVAIAAAGVLVASASPAQDVKQLRAIGEGRALYLVHCAACHGPNARGLPAGTDNQSTPDLTAIALRDGRFDAVHVANHVDGRAGETGCERSMPCWGAAFGHRGVGRDEGRAARRVYTVTKYIAFVQQAEPVVVQ